MNTDKIEAISVQPSADQPPFKIERSPKEAEAAKLFEFASQTQSKMVYFLVTGAIVILGFSIETAPERSRDWTTIILVASWISLLGSAICGFQWLEKSWIQSNINHRRVDCFARIEIALNTARAGGKLQSAKSGEEHSPQDIIDEARRELARLSQQDPASRDDGDKAYRSQRRLLIGGLILYAAFYVWHVLAPLL